MDDFKKDIHNQHDKTCRNFSLTKKCFTTTTKLCKRRLG